MFGTVTPADGHAPLLIHGGLDVVPSKVAAAACAADTQIVCVRAIDTLLQFLACCLLLAVVGLAGGLAGTAGLAASLPVAAMLWLFDGPTQSVVDAHQGTPGVRDLFVIAALVPIALICRRLDRGDRHAASLPLMLLGLLTGTAVFWAYNRGLVVIIVAGAVTVGFALATRSLRPLLAVLAGTVIGLAAVAMVGGRVLMADTLSDILYWARNEAIWRTSFPLVLRLPAFGIAAGTVAIAAPLAWTSLRFGRTGTAIMLAALLIIFGLYGIQSLNRPDLIHLRWALWPAALILTIVIWDRASRLMAGHAGHPNLGLPLLFLLAGLGLDFYSDNSIGRLVLPGLVENARLARLPLPRDQDLVAPDLARVSARVAAAGRCTFAANNAGLVHLLSRMPPCSRFVFGSYVAPDRQADVIADLEAGNPAIILWDSASWWSRIDGRTVRDRTPVLADWIEANYPIRSIIGQYVLLSKQPIAP